MVVFQHCRSGFTAFQLKKGSKIIVEMRVVKIASDSGLILSVWRSCRCVPSRYFEHDTAISIIHGSFAMVLGTFVAASVKWRPSFVIYSSGYARHHSKILGRSCWIQNLCFSTFVDHMHVVWRLYMEAFSWRWVHWTVDMVRLHTFEPHQLLSKDITPGPTKGRDVQSSSIRLTSSPNII